jgi:hypothetical protein
MADDPFDANHQENVNLTLKHGDYFCRLLRSATALGGGRTDALLCVRQGLAKHDKLCHISRSISVLGTVVRGDSLIGDSIFERCNHDRLAGRATTNCRGAA